jgi:hypothetical protein
MQQVDPDDAALLARRFSPLTTADLMGLEAWEFAMRPSVSGADPLILQPHLQADR